MKTNIKIYQEEVGSIALYLYDKLIREHDIVFDNIEDDNNFFESLLSGVSNAYGNPPYANYN